VAARTPPAPTLEGLVRGRSVRPSCRYWGKRQDRSNILRQVNHRSTKESSTNCIYSYPGMWPVQPIGGQAARHQLMPNPPMAGSILTSRLEPANG
jgi:hypothetical protein